MTTDLKNILFLDIETVSAHPEFNQLEEKQRALWLQKSAFFRDKEEFTDEDYYFRKAGIFAEFGKIIVIGLGFLHQENDTLQLRVKSLAGDDEKALLSGFLSVLEKFGNQIRFCAHNGKEFDYPYLCRRILINGLPLPPPLQLMGKKTWDIPHLDTMDMWRFGDYKHYTSLDLLASLFGIQSSKDDISGSEVNEVYYQKKDLPRISEYCAQDVVVTARLFLKLTRNIDLKDEDISIVHE